jgi:hypothetical protein
MSSAATLVQGHADAFVVSGDADGSLKTTESRVLEASGFAATIIRLSLVDGRVHGPGVDAGGRQGHGARGSHEGSDEQRAHEILAQAGPDAGHFG